MSVLADVSEVDDTPGGQELLDAQKTDHQNTDNPRAVKAYHSSW
jgi:hypothetical protein